MLCVRSGGLVRNVTEHDVLNVIDRIRNARILCDRLVREIDATCEIDRNVFKERIAADRLIDVRLCLGIEVDDLCIAAALVVEDALVIPAVLIIADEEALVIGRKRSLARAGKSEEQRRVLPLLVRVRRAVHGGDALERKVVVHHREHALLHLAAVPRVDNDLLTAREVEHDRSLGVEPEIAEVHDARLCRVVDDKIRLELLEFLLRRTNEHVRDKVSLPGNLHDEANRHARIHIRTAKCVNDKEALVAQLTDRDVAHGVPRLLRRTMVVVLILVGRPPDGIM